MIKIIISKVSPQLAADVARPDPELGELHDPQSHVVRKRPAVDKHSAQLVDFPVRVDMRLWT